MTTEPQAMLTEIFSSIQGEGPHIGRRHLFVRLYGCHRRCVYCDTPETVTAMQPPGFRPASVRIEDPPGSDTLRAMPNPVALGDLMDLVLRWDHPRGLHHAVVATGGEPLLQAAFLAEWFPALQGAGFLPYLETSGDLYHELEKVIEHTGIVAMDLKLPSVTGNEAAWGQHRRFLQVCLDAGVEVFVKAVVSGDTAESEIDEAIGLVAAADPRVPFVLQPMTPFGKATHPPTPVQLLHWQARASISLRDVRTIPQAHKLMGAR